VRKTLLLVLLAACAKQNEYVPPPPATVTVAPPDREDVIDYVEFSGTTAPYKLIEIRTRVRGFLVGIGYQAGAMVEKDTVLFQIDPVEFEANVLSAGADLTSAKADLNAAEAAIKSAEAQVALAHTAVQKLEKAYETRAVSEILVLEAQAQRDVAVANLDQAKAGRDVAAARVEVAEARLIRARLELRWTTIKAPRRGRISMWDVEVGALVGVGEPTLLATLVDDEKIFCYFDVSERWLLELRQSVRKEKTKPGNIEDIKVEMALTADVGFPYRGYADYADPVVDTETGTLRARAIFDNSSGLIQGGAYARIRIPLRKRSGALLVTERALGVDQSGSFLMIVNAEGKVERRDVTLGARHGHKVVVLSGVEEKDRIIVGGLQRARPGATVKTESAKKP